jgi:probable HAF family extracellular repeat protein
MPVYTYTTLDDPAAIGANIFAYGINEAGQIVGLYGGSDGYIHGFLYSGGMYTTLDDPSATKGTFARGINAAGQIVGYDNDNTGTHGFLLSGGIYTTLDDPLAGLTQAFGINASSQIVGIYTMFEGDGKPHAFLLSGGLYDTLDDPLGTNGTFAQSINDRGQIVGSYRDASSKSHGFLYNLNGLTYTTLDDPLATNGTLAYGINDAGQIVGIYSDSKGAHGFLYSGGTYTTLDDPLGTHGTFAQGINDAGQIVGFYQDANSGFHGFLLTISPNPPPPAGTTADMILRRGTDGTYEIYEIGNSAILAAYPVGQVGTDWAFVTLGGFNGGDTTGMLLRNSNTGGFEVYDIANNNITGAAFLGGVGLDWRVMGFGNFGSLGETDMILRNVNTGGVEVYDVRNDQIIGANFMGTVGLNWQFSGVGNFSSRGTSDMLLRNSNTGGLEVYDINSNQITGAAFIGTIGLDWQFSGVGNFSGVPRETDLLLRNVKSGGLEVYDINNNHFTEAAFIGTIGLDWQFGGIAPIHAAGASNLVLRNVNTGAFEVYDIANNQITGAAPLGAVGLDWQLGGFAADPPTVDAFGPASATLTEAEVNSGLLVPSTYHGSGFPIATLTMTASNTTLGESATSATQTITVSNPPASIANVTQQLSGQVVLSSIIEDVDTTGTVATFTDTDIGDTAADFTATVNWGDGTTEVGTVTGQNGSFAVAVPGSTHFYSDAGTDTITVTVAGTANGNTAPTNLRYFLAIDGLNGGSTDAAHVGWFEVSSYDVGALAAAMAGSATFSPLTVTVPSTGLTRLFADLANGTTIRSVRLEGVTSGPNPQALYDLTLGNVSVTDYADAASGDKLSFSYRQVALTTTALNPNGSLGSSQTFSWDVALNRADASIPAPVPSTAGGNTAPTNLRYFLAIDGLNGGSTDAAHAGWFEVSSYDVGALAAAMAGSATFSPLTVTFPSTGLTRLFADLANGTTIRSVRLEGVTSGPNPQALYDLTLGNVSVTDYADAASGDKLSFSYRQVALTTTALNPNGSLGSSQTFSWDVALNRADASIPAPVPSTVSDEITLTGNVTITEGGGPNPIPPPATTADLILRQVSTGRYEIYDIGRNSILAAYSLGQVGTDWSFVTLGHFFGSDTTDMLLRSSKTGGFEVYDISNNNITNAGFLGNVGLDWQAMGFGNFSSLGENDMILRNVNTGAVEVYDISNNQITGANFMGTVGLNWQFSGVGNFSGRGTSDMILRDSNTGGLEVYDINNNQITNAAFIGMVGLDWQFSGVGNFSGVPGETDLLLRNKNTGGLEVYDINNNQLTGAAFIGTVGLDWQFAGIGPVHGAGESDLVLRNKNTGAFEVYDIAGNTLVGAASLGAVGLDWQLGGFAADPPTSDSSTSQLVQAMAGVSGVSGVGESLNTAPLNADPSQQSFLTTPHA